VASKVEWERALTSPGRPVFLRADSESGSARRFLEVRDECETECDRAGEDQALPSRGKRNDVG